MCGIAGIFLEKGGRIHPDMPRGLAAALRHRGPDGEGILSEGNVALVHRRLSIIDVAGGAQPISDEGGKVHIICNGEIYNYLSLRADLQAEGVRFKTKSDTEPALHLYRKHGLDFVNHLQGMYALAVYDSEKEALILARDPFGIK
ncbi:MAG: asparagine synthetase B, partial [Proteobacteria bacterium]|nr:asparagine synthetase B [Pseudomonadota bacterium]